MRVTWNAVFFTVSATTSRGWPFTDCKAWYTTPGPETPTLMTRSASPTPWKAPAMKGLSSTALQNTTSLAQPRPSRSAVRAAVCLQTLKDLGAVVEHAGGRRQGNILEGDDAGIVPALFITVVHDEHMVGIVDAETQLVRGGQLHGVCCFGHADIHISFLPKNRKSN